MLAVIQRVSRASVQVEPDYEQSIGGGLVIFLGIQQGDSAEDGEWLARKCAGLRLFRDEQGKFNRSLQDVGGEALVVSQFTLFGRVAKGRRPGFDRAARPEAAVPLYERFCATLAQTGITVKRGIFAAQMLVSLVNDGPVTIMAERRTSDPESRVLH